MKNHMLIFFLLITCFTISAGENYQLMRGRKLDQYMSSGFVKTQARTLSTKIRLKKIRAYYKEKQELERIVFDLSSEKVPEIMVYLSNTNKNILITMKGTLSDKETIIPKKTQMFSTYKIRHLNKNSLSVELTFRRSKEIDVFYLEKPARLVIDARVRNININKYKNKK